jgi:hypothetical protein
MGCVKARSLVSETPGSELGMVVVTWGVVRIGGATGCAVSRFEGFAVSDELDCLDGSVLLIGWGTVLVSS